MNEIKVKDIWYVKFPYEDDPQKSKIRPVIVLDKRNDSLEVLSVKVTSKSPRDIDGVLDEYEVPIFNWQESNLIKPSVARISKIQLIHQNAFLEYIASCIIQSVDNR